MDARQFRRNHLGVLISVKGETVEELKRSPEFQEQNP